MRRISWWPALTMMLAVLLMGTLVLGGSGMLAPGPASAAPKAAPAASYSPQTRDFTVTIVPQLVHQMSRTLPYLDQEFAAGGLLDGKEVFAFSPSTLVVYQGDTVNLQIVNPTDAEHTYTIIGDQVLLNLNIKAQTTTPGSLVANQVGVFNVVCTLPAHLPYQWGQFVVLPASAASP